MNILITVGLNCVVLFVMYKFLTVRLDRRITTGEVLDEMKREVGTIITELNETTDRNIELFETRIAQLKETIEQADRRLGLLKRENEKNSVTTEVRARIGSRDGTPSNASSGTERTAGGAASTQSARYEPAARQGAEHGAATSVHRPSSQQSSRDRIRPVREAPNRERILDFHRQGFAPSVIAQKTGSTIGEVELVISLMQRRG